MERAKLIVEALDFARSASYVPGVTRIALLGSLTTGKAFGGQRDRGLVARYHKLPWIPTDEQWRAVLEAARPEPVLVPGVCLREVLLDLRCDDELSGHNDGGPCV